MTVRPTLIAVLVLAVTTVTHAQVIVYDPAVVTRNSLTAVLKEYLAQLQLQQHSQIRRMAHRLSLFTDLGTFRVPDPPRWRIHNFEDPEVTRFALEYHAALNYGDAGGAAYRTVAQAVLHEPAVLASLGATARRALYAPLATLDLSAAAIIAATDDTGRVRYTGRRELAAIEVLDRDVTDGSVEQSATAVLDKISGAVLIGARQRQARLQLMAAVVEQLAIDAKRARDAEAATANMQIVTWRDRPAVDAAFGVGTGDALRTWRQP